MADESENLVNRALRRQVSLSEFSQPVYIEDAQAVQAVDELVSLTVRTRDGQTIQTIVPDRKSTRLNSSHT